MKLFDRGRGDLLKRHNIGRHRAERLNLFFATVPVGDVP
jgi:hypothetical protein